MAETNDIATARYDEEFFQRVLRASFDDPSIKVSDVNVKAATGKGDNFLSDMLRARVNYSRSSEDKREVNESRSLILKCEPGNGGEGQRLVQKQNLFETELRILRDVLPRIENKLGVQLGPRFIHAVRETPQVLVMEDLAVRGFVVKDRQKGFSIAHATLAIQNLARFHAGSVAVHEKNPESMDGFMTGIFSEHTPYNMHRLLKNCLVNLSEAVKTWSDDRCPRVASKIHSMVGTMQQRIMDVYQHDPDEFCVLNHGDSWVNNMLFVENERGEPREQLFVDYQMVVYTSPALDLLYFLAINPAKDIKCDVDDTLLKRYLETLTTSMKTLGCTTVPPTMDELKKAMHKRRAYAVMAGLVFYPRMILDKEDVEDIDKLLQDGESQSNTYDKPETIKILQKMIPAMEDRGYLD